MTVSINFNNQLQTRTIKVNNKVINGALSQNTQGKISQALLPKFFLRSYGILLHLFSNGDKLGIVGQVKVGVVTSCDDTPLAFG